MKYIKKDIVPLLLLFTLILAGSCSQSQRGADEIEIVNLIKAHAKQLADRINLNTMFAVYHIKNKDSLKISDATSIANDALDQFFPIVKESVGLTSHTKAVSEAINDAQKGCIHLIKDTAKAAEDTIKAAKAKVKLGQ